MNILRTVVQVSEPPPDLVKRTMRLSAERVVTASVSGPTMEEGLGGLPAASHKQAAISPKLFLTHSQGDWKPSCSPRAHQSCCDRRVLLRELRDPSCWPNLWLWDMYLLSLP